MTALQARIDSEEERDRLALIGRTGFNIREGSAMIAARTISERMYDVLIDVPDAPRLGSCTLQVSAISAGRAEREALRRMYQAWGCGAPMRARVQIGR